jgi:hypothetical protein
LTWPQVPAARFGGGNFPYSPANTLRHLVEKIGVVYLQNDDDPRVDVEQLAGEDKLHSGVKILVKGDASAFPALVPVGDHVGKKPLEKRDEGVLVKLPGEPLNAGGNRKAGEVQVPDAARL